MLDVELLRQYFCELGLTHENINEYLENTLCPFDRKYCDWTNENEINKKTLIDYLKQNELLGKYIKLLELTNHKDNRVLKNNNAFLIGKSYIKNKNKKENFNKYVLNNSDVLFAKGLYSNLEYLAHYFLFLDKKILLTECSDDVKHMERVKEYFDKLKITFENTYNKSIEFVDDSYKNKKIYILHN